MSLYSWEYLAKKPIPLNKPKRKFTEYVARWNDPMFDQEHGHWDEFEYDHPLEDLYKELADF